MACNMRAFFSVAKMRKEDEEHLIFMLTDSSKVVGTKQVLRGLASDSLRCVVLSEDADDFLKGRIVAKAAEKGIEVVAAPSMEFLGKLCGIDVGAATAGILKNQTN